MTRLYLVRHGRAAAGWNVDPDPGLDAHGAEQAAEVAERLASLGPMALLSSPLRRCRETAAPLAERWSVPLAIESAVAEIPSPDGIRMTERVEWLRVAMAGRWTALGVTYTDFRNGVASALSSLQTDSVVFSHFVAINAAIGAALGDDRVLIHHLDNCSVTVVDVVRGSLRLVEVGREADTLIR